MEFYFRTKGAKIHLYRAGGFVDEDLGVLNKKLTGKLKTNKLFGEKFELEDISGFFSKGSRYAIKSSKGLDGIIERGFRGTYILK